MQVKKPASNHSQILRTQPDSLDTLQTLFYNASSIMTRGYGTRTMATHPAAAANYSRELGGGLLQRWSTPEDTENIAQLCGMVFRDKEDEPLNIRMMESPCRSHNPPGFSPFSRGRASRSSRNSVRKASTGARSSAARKRESVERAGNRSRPNRAMNALANGCKRS